MIHTDDPRSWYTTYRWKRRSKHQLAEHPLCAICAKVGRVRVATICDHIVPHKGDWNSFWMGDVQSLCKHCHDSAKRFEELRGFERDIGADGWPLDPKHPTYKLTEK